MKVHILDDWFDTLRGLPCFEKLSGHDVTVWTDHEPDPIRLADRVAEAEALVLFRERTRIGADLLGRLPNLRLISQRSVYPHIDLEACTSNGVMLCSNMHNETPSYAAAEMTLALMLSSYRQIPQQTASIRSGQWQIIGRPPAETGPSSRGIRGGIDDNDRQVWVGLQDFVEQIYG